MRDTSACHRGVVLTYDSFSAEPWCLETRFCIQFEIECVNLILRNTGWRVGLGGRQAETRKAAVEG
jgi:hypothetical protein